MSLEDTLRSWASPPGETEQTKCDNAVRAVRKAVDASSVLSKRSIRVFAQGSYCNRTNVRQDSDVDVCVLCTDSFFYDLPDGMTPANFGFTTPASYSYSQFKNDLDSALTSYFKGGAVKRGNKAFDIHENTYRIAADAVACFEYRRYRNDGSYLTGTSFLPDTGNRVENWPEQNYANGVQKNAATGQKFKDVVRILKRLRYKMLDEGVEAADPIPSFLIECLVWNVPDGTFKLGNYKSIVQDSLAHLFNSTIEFKDCKEWGEVNELKYLFWSGQAWTFQQAHTFTSAAWDYLGFE